MDILLTEQNGWCEIDPADVRASDRHALWDAWPPDNDNGEPGKLPLNEKIEVESFDPRQEGSTVLHTPAEILFHNGIVDVATAGPIDLEDIVLLRLPPHKHVERIWVRTRKPFVKAFQWYERT